MPAGAAGGLVVAACVHRYARYHSVLASQRKNSAQIRQGDAGGCTRMHRAVDRPRASHTRSPRRLGVDLSVRRGHWRLWRFARRAFIVEATRAALRLWSGGWRNKTLAHWRLDVQRAADRPPRWGSQAVAIRVHPVHRLVLSALNSCLAVLGPDEGGRVDAQTLLSRIIPDTALIQWPRAMRGRGRLGVHAWLCLNIGRRGCRACAHRRSL